MYGLNAMLAINTQPFQSFITDERLSPLIRAVVILAVGIPLTKLLVKLVSKLVKDRLSLQTELLIVRSIKYILVLVLTMMVLNEFGFKLTALLGAAGILGVAVGFASQTSVSNIISGFFLISEKPFLIGDTIEVEEITGVIDSIDLLSVKLKTYDNRYVRIPNETMIKSSVINLTRFPIRRAQTLIRVDINEDISRVLEILRNIASELPQALKEPAPMVLIDQIGESAVTINFGVWTETANVFNMKNQMIIKVKERFEQEGIKIPFAQVELHSQALAQNKTDKQNT